MSDDISATTPVPAGSPHREVQFDGDQIVAVLLEGEGDLAHGVAGRVGRFHGAQQRIRLLRRRKELELCNEFHKAKHSTHVSIAHISSPHRGALMRGASPSGAAPALPPGAKAAGLPALKGKHL